MPRKRRSIFSSIAILFLALACLAATVFLLGMEAAPRLAEAEFGSPAGSLDRLQRALYSLQLLLQEDAVTLPLDASGSPRTFQIGQGESVNSIASNLEANGLIRDAGAFRLFLIYSGLDTSIKSGSYQLSPAQSAAEIGLAIQDPAPRQASLSILAGWRIEEVAASLPYTGLSISPQDFLTAARSYVLTDDLTNHGPVKGVEGFLFPGSYVLPRTSSSREVLDTVIGSFMDQVTPDIRKGFRDQGLDLYEGVILASLVQREAMVEREQPTIASVFLNRLHQAMKLGSDPTVQFALGYIAEKKTWWKNPLSLDDLKINSPYNTYIIAGLPPGPISSPGLAALRAVAFPASTSYYYFRARCDGSGLHAFSETYDEHLNNACP